MVCKNWLKVQGWDPFYKIIWPIWVHAVVSVCNLSPCEPSTPVLQYLQWHWTHSYCLFYLLDTVGRLYPGEPENWTVGTNPFVLWTPNYTVCSMILDTFTLYVLLTGHFWTQASLIHPGTFHLELDPSGVVTFDLWCDIRDARSRLGLIPTDRIMGVIIRG